MKAPPMQSICMMLALGSHLSVTANTMSSCEVKLNPNMAGKETKAVNLSILRSAFSCRSLSSARVESTGWATLVSMPLMVVYPMVLHLFAWLK